MKRIIYFSILLLAMTACSRQITPSSLTPTTLAPKDQSQAISYQEPDWVSIDNIDAISDEDIWLHATKKQLSDPLIARLVDAYNCCMVFRCLYTDLDLSWRMWWNNASDNEIRSHQSSVKKMDCSIISNPMMRGLAENLQRATAMDIVDTTLREYGAHMDTFVTELVNNYGVHAFGGLTYEDYMSQKDFSNFIDNYDELKSKRLSGDSIYQDQLLERMRQETDFYRQCIYAMEYVHSSADGPYFDKAIPVLIELMCAGKYSPILRDIWRTWRALQASQMGMSRDSAIPNLQYNELRRIVATTILNHIQQHPDDIMAINEFVCLAYIDNINRYCSIAYGNQNFEEQLEMFPDFFDKVVGDSEDE